MLFVDAAFTLTIDTYNTPPSFDSTLKNQQLNYGTTSSYVIPSFSDVDSGDTVTITATSYSGGVDPYTFTTWVPGATRFDFAPGLADVGVYTLTVTIQDTNSVVAPTGAETVIGSFTLTVSIVNTAPVWSSDPPQNLLMDFSETFSYFLPSWSDVDSGDSHTVTVTLDNGSDLPAFMSYHGNPDYKIVLEPGLVEEVGVYVLEISI